MGTLRALFALAVVLAHSYGFVFVGGRNAVQLFYMISGFLISYVIVERKVYKNIRSFYINRYLRLYPIYFIVALLSLFAFAFAAVIGKDIDFFIVYRDAPFAANLLLVISNATIFFQDSRFRERASARTRQVVDLIAIFYGFVRRPDHPAGAF